MEWFKVNFVKNSEMLVQDILPGYTSQKIVTYIFFNKTK